MTTKKPRSPYSEDHTQVAEYCVSIKSLAKMLDVSVRHVERMQAAGKLPPPIRLGRSKRWRIEDIFAWLDDGCPFRSECASLLSRKGAA